MNVENDKIDKMVQWINEHFLSPKAFIGATLSFLLVLGAQAQTDMTQILQRLEQEVAAGNTSDSMMTLKYDSLVRFYGTRDFEKTVFYFQKGVDFTRRIKKDNLEMIFWRRMGVLYFDLGKRDSALIYLHNALKLVEGKEYYPEERATYNAMATIYTKLKEYEKAMEYNHKSLEINKKYRELLIQNGQDFSGSILSELNTYNAMCAIYHGLRNLGKAEEYLLQSIKLIDENRHIPNIVHYESAIVGNLAGIYMEYGRNEEALPLLLRGYELAVESKELGRMVYALQRLSQFYKTVYKDFQQALTYAKEALHIAEQTKQPELLNRADEAMMAVYLVMKDNKTALYYAERIAERTPDDDWSSLKNLYKKLIAIYASMGNAEKAEEYVSKYDETTVKASEKSMQEVVSEMEVKYDVQEKELKISQQQTEIARNQTRQYLLIGGLIAAVVLLAMLVYIIVLHRHRNRTLAETNAIKDKFFTIISHDLKNPAIAQRNMLQLLAERADRLDAEIVHPLREALDSANGLVDLLKNLLNWAKIQTGRDMYHPLQFNLISALQIDISVVKTMAERKGVAFETEIPPIAFVTADENMLTTVIRNLMVNAVKFTASGGEITLHITEKSGRWMVAVRDTGTGMTPEQQQNLFRIDRQITSRGTAGEQSSGLGLIVCNEMLQKNGYMLFVESEEGKGSRFWFQV